MPLTGILKKFISTACAGALAFVTMPGYSVLLSSAEAATPSSQIEESSSDVASDTGDAAREAVIVYDEGVSASEKSSIESVCEEYGAQVESVSQADGSASDAVAKAVLADAGDAEELVEELQDEPGVALAQRNFVYRTLESDAASAESEDSAASPNDTESSKQYFLDSWNGASADEASDDEESSEGALVSGANVRSAWLSSKSAEKAGGESAVTVAVLDTGVDVEHEDLADTVDTEHMGTVVALEQGGYAVERGVCEDVSSDGHGTHVAGIVSAATDNGKGVAGVSYNATLIPINVYYQSVDEDGESEYVTDTVHLISALSYLQGLIDDGEVANLHVVNMSLGSYSDEATESDYALEQAIKTLRDNYNVLTVCAGGNGDEDGNPSTDRLLPGDFEESLSVSWLGKDGKVAPSADYNEEKDISAPGTDIYSTSNESDSSYSSLSGSSMSAPIVSGAAALIWAKYPNLTTEEVRTALVQTAHEIPDAPEELGSAGAVDVADALSYATEHYSDDARIDISKAAVASSAFSDAQDWYLPYTGGARYPSFTLSYDDETLVRGTDYRVTYQRNTNPGTALVTFTGIGKYKGVKTVRFDIVQDIASCTIASVSAQTYTGRSIRPSLEITNEDGESLVQGLDFVVEDLDNLNVGQATATVRGIHAYRGTATVKFWIVERSSDQDTKNVSLNVKKVTEKALASVVKSNTTTVTLGSKTTGISSGAFASFGKVTKLVLKTKKLTKSSVKGALTGSNVKTVQVSLGSKKLNAQYLKKYKAYFS